MRETLGGAFSAPSRGGSSDSGWKVHAPRVHAHGRCAGDLPQPQHRLGDTSLHTHAGHTPDLETRCWELPDARRTG